MREKHCYAGLQPSSLKHCIETSISYQRPNKRFLVNAADGQPLESEPKNVLNSVKDSLDAFYRFSRPHTVIGTVGYLNLVGQSQNSHYINLIHLNFNLLIILFPINFWRLILFFLEAGIEHSLSFPTCSREAYRLFTIIFCWDVGGEA